MRRCFASPFSRRPKFRTQPLCVIPLCDPLDWPKFTPIAPSVSPANYLFDLSSCRPLFRRAPTLSISPALFPRKRAQHLLSTLSAGSHFYSSLFPSLWQRASTGQRLHILVSLGLHLPLASSSHAAVIGIPFLPLSSLLYQVRDVTKLKFPQRIVMFLTFL